MLAWNITDKDLLMGEWPMGIPLKAKSDLCGVEELRELASARKFNTALSNLRMRWYLLKDQGKNPDTIYADFCRRYLIRHKRRGVFTVGVYCGIGASDF